MEHPIIIDSRGKATKDTRGFIGKFCSSTAGKNALAAAMIAPLRRNLDYHGMARRCLMVQPLPQGAQPIYNKAPDVTAMVTDGYMMPGPPLGFKHKKIRISSRGKAHDAVRVFGQRITIPTFEVFSNPTIYIGDVTKRRFNLIDLVNPKGRKFPITISPRGKAEKYNPFDFMYRAVQNARNQIMQQEDEQIFKILDSIAAGDPK